jgi:hypothetical protein
LIEANDNATTNPAIEPANAGHIDPRARLLRQMLDALAAHREAKADPETDDKIVRPDFGPVIRPQPPRWMRHMQAAAGDGVEQSLVALIRKEGWRALAEGGLEAMRDLADWACGDNGYLLSLLDHRWDGIGTRRHGHWVC